MTTVELASLPVHRVMAAHPVIADFMATLELPGASEADQTPLWLWVEQLAEESLFDLGMDRVQLLDHLQRLADEVDGMRAEPDEVLHSLTLIGGQDKSGAQERVMLTFRAGEVVCIVGPTGSGKSRLLGDIECLAQGDTPTGRRILLNGQVPDPERRDAPDRKLVAQLSQNMNFVVDLQVGELIAMHARCRMVAEPERMAERVVACANSLTGEQFGAEVSVTQLSGGQTRALMIADVALLSASPIVLIDEIENAGVDRRKALELLTGGDKIVLISTHDPLLALRGVRRIVIRNGGIAEVIDTSAVERRNLARIERMDATLMGIRDRLRQGLRIDEELSCPP